jgi:hypothetical protein
MGKNFYKENSLLMEKSQVGAIVLDHLHETMALIKDRAE